MIYRDRRGFLIPFGEEKRYFNEGLMSLQDVPFYRCAIAIEQRDLEISKKLKSYQNPIVDPTILGNIAARVNTSNNFNLNNIEPKLKLGEKTAHEKTLDAITDTLLGRKKI
jgi:hypothetical protein